MTKKDYIIIAKCLNKVYAPAWAYLEQHQQIEHEETLETTRALNTVYDVGQILGNMFTEFQIDNPKFDWAKFKKAVYK